MLWAGIACAAAGLAIMVVAAFPVVAKGLRLRRQQTALARLLTQESSSLGAQLGRQRGQLAVLKGDLDSLARAYRFARKPLVWAALRWIMAKVTS